MAGLSGCGETRFDTTTLPRIGGRQIVLYRCNVDLRSGRASIERPAALDTVEEGLWEKKLTGGLQEGRRYEIILEEKRSKERARFVVRETDGGTGEPLRTIPVQEFRGFHDGTCARAVTFKDGQIRFCAEFWVND